MLPRFKGLPGDWGGRSPGSVSWHSLGFALLLPLGSVQRRWGLQGLLAPQSRLDCLPPRFVTFCSARMAGSECQSPLHRDQQTGSSGSPHGSHNGTVSPKRVTFAALPPLRPASTAGGAGSPLRRPRAAPASPASLVQALREGQRSALVAAAAAAADHSLVFIPEVDSPSRPALAALATCRRWPSDEVRLQRLTSVWLPGQQLLPGCRGGPIPLPQECTPGSAAIPSHAFHAAPCCPLPCPALPCAGAGPVGL